MSHTKNELVHYLQDPVRTTAREALWDRVQFDNFDPDELASVPLDDLMFVCTRAEAHHYTDVWLSIQNNDKEEGNTNAD